MKKIVLGILLLALLLLGASALAESIDPVPVDQIGYVMPSGTSGALSISTQPGSLRITIDDSKVNWASAFASSGLNGAEAQMIWQIKAYTGAKSVRILTDYTEGDQNALAVLETAQRYTIDTIDGYGVPCQPGGMPITERGQRIASAILDMDYVVPQDVSNVIYVRWYDQSGTALCTQKLNVAMTHTQKKAFTAKVSDGTPADRIQPDQSTGVTVLEKKTGSVTYWVPAPNTNVKTRITAPAGATQYATQGNMKSGGFSSVEPIEGGCAVVSLTSNGNVSSSTQTVYFLDARGNLVETVSVNVNIQPEQQMKVWPAYVNSDMFPLGKDQLEIINDAASMGYTYTYDQNTGHLKCSFNGKQASGGLRQNKLTLRIKDPDWGAVGCRIYQIGSNSLLGPSAGSVEKMRLELDKGYPNGPAKISSSGAVVHTDEYNPFRVIKPGGDAITLYVPDASAMVENYVQLYVVEWTYEDYTECQYFYMTTEPFTATLQTYPAYAEGALRGPVQHPCVVCGQQLKLVVIRYITESDSVWHYEMYLVDENGRTVQPNGPVKIYLPYPDGHIPGCRYTLHHYTNSLYSAADVNTYQPMEIRDTEYGLMFETASFSPFILSRQSDEPAASQPPKTGDTTPITLWASLLLLSAAAALLLLRKRKAA